MSEDDELADELGHLLQLGTCRCLTSLSETRGVGKGFIGKADKLSEPASVKIQRSDVAIAIDDHVILSTSDSGSTAMFTGDHEAVIRLIGGRLTARYTPADVEVTGKVTLDDLLRVFPGY